MNWIFTLKFI